MVKLKLVVLSTTLVLINTSESFEKMRFNRFLLSLSLMVLTVFVMTTSAQSTAYSQSLPSDEKAIYSIAIQAVFPKWRFDDKSISLLVIESRTRINRYDGPDILDEDIQAAFPVSAEILSDFRAKNKAPSVFQATLDLPIPSKPYDSSLVKGQFPNGGWQKFFQDYPGSPGLLSLSSIGFNKTRDQAFVYVAHAYGVDGGQGHVFLLKKRGHTWKVKKHDTVWAWVG